MAIANTKCYWLYVVLYPYCACDLDCATAYFLYCFSDIVLDQVINNKMLEEELRDDVRKVLNSQHVFAHQKRKRSIMPGSESDKNLKKSFSKSKYILYIFSKF